MHSTAQKLGAMPRDDLIAEIKRLRALVEDAINTMESMDLHVDNPLYERLCKAMEA